MLHSLGVPFDQCFDELNLTQPALVANLHRDYIQAGAQVILANTFGANRYKLAKHGLENKVDEINRAGVELARRAVVDSDRLSVLVGGDVGPLGVRIAPFGRVQLDEARAAFAEQIIALASAGADFIVIETMSDLYEIRQAILAAHAAAAGLPVVASVTFTRDDRTLLGDSPE
jgi:methionine synthase / methylenetetrahydrofolate reductase(NADPH)